MKILLLFLSFLLFNSFLSFAAGEAAPVLDADGERLNPGQQYYVVSSAWGAGGGGVNFGSSTGHETCPLTVIQERRDRNRGLPVTFTPANAPKDGVIRLDTAVSIKFSGSSDLCTDSNVWKLDYDERSGKYFIATDGDEENSGCENMYSWFQFARGRGGYSLVFCPAVAICENVGIFYERDGTRRLTLSDTPFTIGFQKARGGMKNETIIKSVTSA